MIFASAIISAVIFLILSEKTITLMASNNSKPAND
jgi:hypothetical protein